LSRARIVGRVSGAAKKLADLAGVLCRVAGLRVRATRVSGRVGVSLAALFGTHRVWERFYGDGDGQCVDVADLHSCDRFDVDGDSCGAGCAAGNDLLSPAGTPGLGLRRRRPQTTGRGRR